MAGAARGEGQLEIATPLAAHIVVFPTTPGENPRYP